MSWSTFNFRNRLGALLGLLAFCVILPLLFFQPIAHLPAFVLSLCTALGAYSTTIIFFFLLQDALAAVLTTRRRHHHSPS